MDKHECIKLPDNLENFKGNININCCCCSSGGSSNTNPKSDCSSCRQSLTKDTTYYVRKDGNDNNDGLTEATAFATIQKVTAHLITIDGAGYRVTVDIGPGTWTGRSFELGVHISNAVVRFTGLVGVPELLVRGSGTKTIIDGESTYCGFFALDDGVIYHLENLAFDNCTSTIYNQGTTHLLGGITIGTSTSYHLAVEQNRFSLSGDLTITGNAERFANLVNNSTSDFIAGSKVNFVDNPAFTWTVVAKNTSTARFNGEMTGTAQGKRYLATHLSIIETWNKGANYIPGTVAGSTEHGGIYL